MKNNSNEENKFSRKAIVVVGIVCLIIIFLLINKENLLDMKKTSEEVSDFTNESVSIQEVQQNTEILNDNFSVDMKEQDDVIEVSTIFGTLTYPSAFSDVIQVYAEQIEEVSKLKFVGIIGEEQLGLFDICYGGTSGDFVKQIILEDGTTMNVYIILYDLPENMSEDDFNTFCAAQEIVNDIVTSIEKK